MPQIDNFANYGRKLDSPATKHFEITPEDGVDLPIRPRVLRVTVSGNVSVRDAEGEVITYAVSAGEILQFSAVGVEATGTTATVVGWL